MNWISREEFQAQLHKRVYVQPEDGVSIELNKAQAMDWFDRACRKKQPSIVAIGILGMWIGDEKETLGKACYYVGGGQ